jgi:hypothetical protein
MLPRSWVTKDEDGSTTLVVVRKEGCSFVVETTLQTSPKANQTTSKQKAPEINLKENAKLPATKRQYLNPATKTYVSYARAKQLGLI